MKYTVVLRRTADGLERTIENDWPGSGVLEPFEGVEFFWTEGNFGCDCNMADQFARAAGEPDPEPGYPCSGSEFQLVSITLGERTQTYA